MKISVIVPTYKRAEFLNKCLESIAGQTRKADEIITVLRKEDSESINVARKFNATVVFVRQPGIIQAADCGLQHAGGDVVCYIDDDAIATENWLERIEKQFQNPHTGAVCGPVIPLVNGKLILRPVKKVFRIYWWGWITHNSQFVPQETQEVQCFRQCNSAFRKKLVNRLDESLLGDHCRFEVEIALRILNQGYKIICDPKIQVYHHIAPRKDDFKRINDPERIYNTNFNHSYVLYKNFSSFRRFIFILFTFLIGDFENRGLLMFLKDLILHPKNKSSLIQEFKGRLGGLLVARKKIKEEKSK